VPSHSSTRRRNTRAAEQIATAAAAGRAHSGTDYETDWGKFWSFFGAGTLILLWFRPGPRFARGLFKVTAEGERAQVNAAAAMSDYSVTVTGEGSSRRLLLSVADQPC